jgi:[ribosomal protein S5]-alanine N-acetyltransferase
VALPVPLLRTARLVLRPSAMSELADYHALQLDLGSQQFGRKSPRSIAESEERLARTLEHQDAGELLSWSLSEGESPLVIGIVGLVRIDALHRRAEVAYQLHSTHQRKGFVTEALTRVALCAFAELGFHRLEGQTHPDNRKSIGVLERCGFVREGLLRQNYLLDGVFQDSLVYGRLATDGRISRDPVDLHRQ